MFQGLGNFATLLKQAQQIGGRLQGISEELRAKRVAGNAGGGMVEVEVNGLQEVIRCRIDPSLFSGGDRELVEDLVAAATNQALAKAKQVQADAMKSAAGGLAMPGLDEALARLTRLGKTDDDSGGSSNP